MKTITKEKWKKCLPCNKQIKKDGTKFMLYNKEEMTVWGPVKIKDNENTKTKI